VVLLRDGRVVQNGSPDELYGRPANVFAARFIGTPPMNVNRGVPGHRARTGCLVAAEDVRLGAAGLSATVEAVE